jgi:hypothetical protein
MNLRPLILDDQIKKRAKKVVDYARKNPYLPGAEVNPPGEDPGCCLVVPMGYLCVFSFTEIPGEGLYRDLSVSVPETGKFPNEFALFTLAAELFDFHGWDGTNITPLPKGWLLGFDTGGEAVRVAQLVNHQ